MDKIKLICVVGATASGKTALAVGLAESLGGEVISADSMQVYKGMPIATAAATAEEQKGIPHHLLGFLEPGERFSVGEFVPLAKKTAFEIAERGKVPIVAGGTGLFIDSLAQNISFAGSGADEELRNELEKKSTDELYAELLSLDGEAAENIHKNNRKRVIRALELYYGGISKTEQNIKSREGENPFDTLYIGIGCRDREKLYERINKRVDLMVENGLEEEARLMLSRVGKTAAQAIGHKELKPYIDGEITLEEAVENLKRETRRYAKRQLTWFRRNGDIHWFNTDELEFSELVRRAAALAEDFLND
ncbi:MAG: tRNA (adenosine(37)-N6)-dimethylallyltransferase MiaA [Eubacterium sp.]|nr:tRNA (adenosine(37)-N6)-dimethylallyltransferase MiaA [Eubacterium sp.]